MIRAEDEKFMRLALREAARGIGRTSPNPAVGAVLVKAGRVIARGWHRAAGLPHAEIEALKKNRTPALARGATLYVTLEPCSTCGRTPPCTDAITGARIARVVVGATDPNPRHAGCGFSILRKAGIRVTSGVLAAECAALNPGFNKWITTGMPLVIAKAGLSLDGRLTRAPGRGQWLTSPQARADAMCLRAQVDAILIGAETLRADNPHLTIRGVPGPPRTQPWRVVLTRSGRLPKHAHLFTDEHRGRTLVYQGKSLRPVLRDLARRGCTSVMIEGGGKLLGAAFDSGLVDRVHFYIAPILAGGPDVLGGRGAATVAESILLSNTHHRPIGPDILLTGEVVYPEKKALPRKPARHDKPAATRASE